MPPKTTFFCIIWQMGGSRCVQSVPTGCGINLPRILRNLTSDNNTYCATCYHRVWEQFAHDFEKSNIRPKVHILIQDLYATIVCSSLCFLLRLKQSATGKMTRPTIGSFHGFHEKVTSTGYVPVRSLFFMSSLLSRLSV